MKIKAASWKYINSGYPSMYKSLMNKHLVMLTRRGEKKEDTLREPDSNGKPVLICATLDHMITKAYFYNCVILTKEYSCVALIHYSFNMESNILSLANSPMQI